MNVLTQLASTTPASGGLFDALGIDWKTLILQIIAFVILVWLLGKFVYPWLMKSVDERQTNIEAATRAADDAKVAANQAQDQVAELLRDAKLSAADIVATAKLESAAALDASEKKAQQHAERIVTDAQVEIAREIQNAKTALHNETLELVELATRKVIGKVVTQDIDAKLIEDSVKAVK